MEEGSDSDELAALTTTLRRHLQRRERAGIRILAKGKPPAVKPPPAEESSLLRGMPNDFFADNSKPLQATSLEELRAAIGDCERCKLCSGRTNLVFGVGNPKAKLMFVGEGPGRDEDLQGEPFVGRAGQLLTDIITKGMGLKSISQTSSNAGRRKIAILNRTKSPPASLFSKNKSISFAPRSSSVWASSRSKRCFRARFRLPKCAVTGTAITVLN